MSHKEIEKILSTGSAFINRCVVEETTKYHTHNFVEIAYVADGRGTHRIGDTEYPVKKGDLFLINYDIPHEFLPKEEPLLVYNCIFTPAYFNAALGESRNFFDITDHFLLNNLYSNLPTDYIFATATGSENHHIFNIYERMLQEFTEQKIGYRDILRGYVIELLVIICRLKLSIDSGKSQRMMGALEYISDHYKENMTAEDLADFAGFSASHFRRLFKDFTGKTLNNYLQTLRIEEACRLLKDKERNVEEIAREVGYRDMKHFYSVFKKITGRLPKNFR